ncbi:MAG: hypothetical protein AAGF01_22835 [Cyanobacteria bacterium P01_G01_bin.38]
MATLASCLVSACAIASCRQFASPPNQQQRVNSPSGRYQLSVPIEYSFVFDDGSSVWQVTIRENEYGSIVYEDLGSEFLSRFNVYWLWDDESRVWLYNSDDGRVYVWTNTPQGWDKQQWGYGRTREISDPLTPPEALYPDYAK